MNTIKTIVLQQPDLLWQWDYSRSIFDIIISIMIKFKIHHSTNYLTLSNSNVTTNDVNALNSQDYVISGLYYWPGPLYTHVRQHYGLSFKSDRPNHVILTPRGLLYNLKFTDLDHFQPRNTCAC